MCCSVSTRCCFCFDLWLGVRTLACLLILLETTFIVLGVCVLPHFLFAILPTSSIGLLCHLLLLLATIKGLSRWLMLPWLIYAMIIVVGLGLAAVLAVVVVVANSDSRHGPIVVVGATLCLVAAGLLLYFWVVVLELFLQLGPFYGSPPVMLGPMSGVATSSVVHYAPPMAMQPYYSPHLMEQPQSVMIYQQQPQHLLGAAVT